MGVPAKKRCAFLNAEGCVLAIPPRTREGLDLFCCLALPQMPLEERGRRLRCNPERREGERELPLPGNELERDPADKEIFKVQLMSEMSHWLNETKVRLGNKSPRCKERGWWGCKRQRVRHS